MLILLASGLPLLGRDVLVGGRQKLSGNHAKTQNVIGLALGNIVPGFIPLRQSSRYDDTEFFLVCGRMMPSL